MLGLGLEHSSPWPREGLFSERLSLALASDFFVLLALALASSLVSSTPPLVFTASLLGVQQLKQQCQASAVYGRQVGRWQLDSKIERFLCCLLAKSTSLIKCNYNYDYIRCMNHEHPNLFNLLVTKNVSNANFEDLRSRDRSSVARGGIGLKVCKIARF